MNHVNNVCVLFSCLFNVYNCVELDLNWMLLNFKNGWWASSFNLDWYVYFFIIWHDYETFYCFCLLFSEKKNKTNRPNEIGQKPCLILYCHNSCYRYLDVPVPKFYHRFFKYRLADSSNIYRYIIKHPVKYR